MWGSALNTQSSPQSKEQQDRNKVLAPIFKLSTPANYALVLITSPLLFPDK